MGHPTVVSTAAPLRSGPARIVPIPMLNPRKKIIGDRDARQPKRRHVSSPCCCAPHKNRPASFIGFSFLCPSVPAQLPLARGSRSHLCSADLS